MARFSSNSDEAQSRCSLNKFEGGRSLGQSVFANPSKTPQHGTLFKIHFLPDYPLPWSRGPDVEVPWGMRSTVLPRILDKTKELVGGEKADIQKADSIFWPFTNRRGLNSISVPPQITGEVDRAAVS